MHAAFDGGGRSDLLRKHSDGTVLVWQMNASVSGTDGYFDSGTLSTNASGQVSFGVPAGAPGVTDTISVSAVISGRSATVTNTW